MEMFQYISKQEEQVTQKSKAVQVELSNNIMVKYPVSKDQKYFVYNQQQPKNPCFQGVKANYQKTQNFFQLDQYEKMIYQDKNQVFKQAVKQVALKIQQQTSFSYNINNMIFEALRNTMNTLQMVNLDKSNVIKEINYKFRNIIENTQIQKQNSYITFVVFLWVLIVVIVVFIKENSKLQKS